MVSVNNFAIIHKLKVNRSRMFWIKVGVLIFFLDFLLASCVRTNSKNHQ
jgi:hypothetical protein